MLDHNHNTAYTTLRQQDALREAEAYRLAALVTAADRTAEANTRAPNIVGGLRQLTARLTDRVKPVEVSGKPVSATR